MKPFDIVCEELKAYPTSLFLKQPKLNRLCIAITTLCTNTCAHCANATQKNETMSLETITHLLHEGKLNNIEQIILWGGEPFLHKDIYTIIKKTTQLGLNLNIITNGFWGATVAAAEQIFEAIDKNTTGHNISMFLSCDVFHQSNTATPVENIANIVSVYLNKYSNSKTLRLTIKNTSTPQDQTLPQLYILLRKSFSEALINNFMHHHVKSHALDCSVGRAQHLNTSFKGKTEIQGISKLFPETFIDKFQLFISANGTACIQQNTVGEELLNFGNIYTQSLSQLCADITQNKRVLFLCSNPFQHFLFPFRKFINLSSLFSHTSTYNELLVSLYKINSPDFDRRAELERARLILNNAEVAQSEYAKAKETIYLYGDITDVYKYNLSEKDFKL